ncbi:MAG: hypothetical protein FJX44_09930 [Alphaproteobacteria bacterium]|nr:hypothetical protein [Alphaproteobacteria bacterium]
MRVGPIAALLAAFVMLGIGLGLFFYYRWIGGELVDIRSRLVTEEQLARTQDSQTISGIKLAPIQCARVYDLRINPIARRLRRAEIKALWRHCEKIADVAAGLDNIGRQSAP